MIPKKILGITQGSVVELKWTKRSDSFDQLLRVEWNYSSVYIRALLDSISKVYDVMSIFQTNSWKKISVFHRKVYIFRVGT